LRLGTLGLAIEFGWQEDYIDKKAEGSIQYSDGNVGR
jgi:hypothetical protein